MENERFVVDVESVMFVAEGGVLFEERIVVGWDSNVVGGEGCGLLAADVQEDALHQLHAGQELLVAVAAGLLMCPSATALERLGVTDVGVEDLGSREGLGETAVGALLRREITVSIAQEYQNWGASRKDANSLFLFWQINSKLTRSSEQVRLRQGWADPCHSNRPTWAQPWKAVLTPTFYFQLFGFYFSNMESISCKVFRDI